MTKQKSLKPLIALNMLLFMAVGSIIYFVMVPPADRSAQVNQLPAFGMEGLSGDEFGSANLKGDLMLVNIFASWCTPCLAEHPFLMDLKNQDILPIYGIALKDEKEAIQTYLDDHGNPYVSVGMDYAGLVPGALRLAGVPSTILVDQSMTIHWTFQGPITKPVIDTELIPLIETLRQDIKG